MTFEFIDTDRVRIGASTVRVQIADPPLRDATTHLVEATSGPSDKLLQEVSPADLAGVKAESIPKGLQVTIYRPETKVTGLDYIGGQRSLWSPDADRAQLLFQQLVKTNDRAEFR